MRFGEGVLDSRRDRSRLSVGPLGVDLRRVVLCGSLCAWGLQEKALHLLLVAHLVGFDAARHELIAHIASPRVKRALDKTRRVELDRSGELHVLALDLRLMHLLIFAHSFAHAQLLPCVEHFAREAPVGKRMRLAIVQAHVQHNAVPRRECLLQQLNKVKI